MGPKFGFDLVLGDRLQDGPSETLDSCLDPSLWVLIRIPRIGSVSSGRSLGVTLDQVMPQFALDVGTPSMSPYRGADLSTGKPHKTL